MSVLAVRYPEAAGDLTFHSAGLGEEAHLWDTVQSCSKLVLSCPSKKKKEKWLITYFRGQISQVADHSVFFAILFHLMCTAESFPREKGLQSSHLAGDGPYICGI